MSRAILSLLRWAGFLGSAIRKLKLASNPVRFLPESSQVLGLDWFSHQMPAEDVVSNHSVQVLTVRTGEGNSRDGTKGWVGRFRPIEDCHHSSLRIANLNPHERCHVKKTLAIHSHAECTTLRRFVERLQAKEGLSVVE